MCAFVKRWMLAEANFQMRLPFAQKESIGFSYVPLFNVDICYFVQDILYYIHKDFEEVSLWK